MSLDAYPNHVAGSFMLSVTSTDNPVPSDASASHAMPSAIDSPASDAGAPSPVNRDTSDTPGPTEPNGPAATD